MVFRRELKPRREGSRRKIKRGLDSGYRERSARTMNSARNSPERSFATGLTAAFRVTLFGLLLVAVLAMFISRHIPSRLATHMALPGAALMALFVAWESRNGGFLHTAESKSSALLRYAWLRVPLMSIFMFLMALTAIGEGLLAVVTAAIGSPAVKSVTVTGVSYSRRHCDHFDIAEVAWLLNTALCAAEDQLARARPGDVLVLEGVESRFGMNVERLRLMTTEAGSSTQP